MNVTYLNLVLGVPLTHFYHLSAFLQVWSSQPSQFLHSLEQKQDTQGQTESLRAPTYIIR